MLEVQKYLRDSLKSLEANSGLYEPENALVCLETTHGIKYNIWEDLVVLNYCQIKSEKSSLSDECRSLVLELGSWNVVSRSFDRFYNVGEAACPDFDITKCIAYEKLDGSIIGIFHWKDRWLYRTRSMIMPETVINNNIEQITWKDRIEEALADFYDYPERAELYEDSTFICELTCPENRVVVKYDHDRSWLHLLSIRQHGGYHQIYGLIPCAVALGFYPLLRHAFDTIEACAKTAAALRSLEEGYVIYQNGKPIAKMKNPAYVAAHHLRGEGCLTEKRVLDLIIMNEYSEYLSIFPEDTEKFTPYITAYQVMFQAFNGIQMTLSVFTGTQKDFAMMYKDTPEAAVAFSMKKGVSQKDSWERLTQTAKRNMITSYKLTK